MTDIATLEPAGLVAGDTWQWRRSLADYPAPTWVLTYYLRGRFGEHSFAAVADGADHLVTVAKATTAAYKAGDYELIGVAASSTERQTVYRARFVIAPDPTQIGAGHDNRSHARKTLEAIQAVIEQRATKDQEEYSIAGRTLKRTPLAELRAMESEYRARVQAEEQGAAARQGRNTNRIVVRL